MTERTPAKPLTDDQLRRVLTVFAFDGCDCLFWRVDAGTLEMFVTCSDFFTWACADAEPIETEQDVAALEQARLDLIQATGDRYPLWIGELYAARRRRQPPADFMTTEGSRSCMDAKTRPLFQNL